MSQTFGRSMPEFPLEPLTERLYNYQRLLDIMKSHLTR